MCLKDFQIYLNSEWAAHKGAQKFQIFRQDTIKTAKPDTSSCVYFSLLHFISKYSYLHAGQARDLFLLCFSSHRCCNPNRSRQARDWKWVRCHISVWKKKLRIIFRGVFFCILPPNTGSRWCSGKSKGCTSHTRRTRLRSIGCCKSAEVEVWSRDLRPKEWSRSLSRFEEGSEDI